MSSTAQHSSDAVAALRAWFAAHPGEVAAAYVFGSHARGTGRPDSDVDLAVLRGNAATGTLDDLAPALAMRLQGEAGLPVDLVVLDHAPVDLVHRVLRDGILVAEGDRGARIAFEVKARNAYFDLLPYLQEHRRPRRTTA